jgi:hypothetical protein
VTTTVVFADADAFNAWHDAECAVQGIPHPGYNAETGEPAITDQWTTAAAAPIIVDGQVCMTTTDEQVAGDPVLAALPTIVVKYPVPPRSDVDENGVPASVITEPEWDWHQPLPPQWTDPNTGTTYSTDTGMVV